MEKENLLISNEQPGEAGDLITQPPFQQDISIPPEVKTPEAQAPPEWLKYRVRGYLITMAVCIVVLYVVNNLLNIYVPWIPGDFSKFFWNILNNVYNHVEITYLSKTFAECLWAINLFLLIGIMGNFCLLLYRPRWFHHLVQAIIAGLAVLAIYVVYKIYPFSFESATVNREIRIALVVLAAGSGVLAIYGLVQFVFNLSLQMRNRPPPEPPVAGPLEQVTEAKQEEKPEENITHKPEVDNNQNPEP